MKIEQIKRREDQECLPNNLVFKLLLLSPFPDAIQAVKGHEKTRERKREKGLMGLSTGTSFFLPTLQPQQSGENNKILGVLIYDEPKAMGAVGQEAETLLRGWQLLPDRFHANAAGFVPRSGHGKGLLHVDLVLAHALLHFTRVAINQWQFNCKHKKKRKNVRAGRTKKRIQ